MGGTMNADCLSSESHGKKKLYLPLRMLFLEYGVHITQLFWIHIKYTTMLNMLVLLYQRYLVSAGQLVSQSNS